MSDQYRFTIIGMIIFELKSLIGRLINRRGVVSYDGCNYLNLGCGSNALPEFVNADFFKNYGFWKRKKVKIDWMVDLRYPIKCKDNSFEGIFFEHTLEHLYPDQAHDLLVEIYRIMKDGAVLRIIVPDLKKYVDFYNAIDSNGSRIDPEFAKRFNSGAEAIRNLTQNYLHVSVWDVSLLITVLKGVGFSKVQEKCFGSSDDPKLLVELEERKWESLYVDAIK